MATKRVHGTRMQAADGGIADVQAGLEDTMHTKLTALCLSPITCILQRR